MTSRGNPAWPRRWPALAWVPITSLTVAGLLVVSIVLGRSSPSLARRDPSAAALVATTAPSSIASVGSTATPSVVCGDTPLLSGPRRPPSRSVTVPAGNDTNVVGETWLVRPNTTYWFSPGVHTLGTGEYGQVDPKNGDTFIGAPGAVIDGQGVNQSAFDGTATNVTIEYLTVRSFAPPNGQNVVNHDDGADWTIEFNTVEDNTSSGSAQGPDYPGGAALGMGSGDVYEYNCLTRNGEYGLNAAGTGTLFAYNEVSWNGKGDFPDMTGCGCSGGIKYWDSADATVEDNYIHDNYNVGLWFDTDNVGAFVEGNYITRNWAEGMIYEISYNADISANSFLDNGWGVGSDSGPSDFPLGAGLYVNGSGGSAAVNQAVYDPLIISGNVFMDNWDGIVIYQNPNRICGTSANSSTGFCTLVDPSMFTTTSCPAHISGSTPLGIPDYFDGCQWKSDNIQVSGNIFNFDPDDIVNGKSTLPDETGSDCYSGPSYLDTSKNPPSGNDYWCGFNGMFAAEGSTPPFDGYVVANAMMGKRDPSGEVPDRNLWKDNVYTGPWAFQAYVQGSNPVSTDLYPNGVATTLDFHGWRSVWGEDAGSTANP
jgi:Right handed beta helix region